MFKIYLEPESPNERACLRYMLNRNRQMRGGGLRYMLNRNRRSPMRGRVLCVEPKSPNEGLCLRFMMSRNRLLLLSARPSQLSQHA